MGAANETAGEGEGSGMNDKGGWRIKLFNLDFFQDFKKRKTFFEKRSKQCCCWENNQGS